MITGLGDRHSGFWIRHSWSGVVMGSVIERGDSRWEFHRCSAMNARESSGLRGDLGHVA
jgi:hypothetical protein